MSKYFLTNLTLLFLLPCILLALEPEERDKILKMPEPERKAYLEKLDKQIQEQLKASEEQRKERRDATRAEQAAQKQNDVPELYEVDPLLKQAYENYLNYKGRDRDRTIALFEQYIKNNPESVFLPEIYFTMSNMYCGNANTENGESINLKKMQEYALKAWKGYGGKFSYDGSTAYYNLAFLTGSFQKRLEYYDWLLGLKKMGAVEGFYNVRSIEMCIKGWSPQYTPKQLKEGWTWFQEHNLPQLILSTEKQIYQDSFQPNRNTYMDLSIIAKRYPDTELGRQARHALDEADEALGIGIYNLMDIDNPITIEKDTITDTDINAGDTTTFIDNNQSSVSGKNRLAHESKNEGKSSQFSSQSGIHSHGKFSLLFLAVPIAGVLLCYEAIAKRKKV